MCKLSHNIKHTHLNTDGKKNEKNKLHIYRICSIISKCHYINEEMLCMSREETVRFRILFHDSAIAGSLHTHRSDVRPAKMSTGRADNWLL